MSRIPWEEIKDFHDWTVEYEIGFLNNIERENLPLFLNRSWFSQEAKKEFIRRLKEGLKETLS
jgi:hypothetical protein